MSKPKTDVSKPKTDVSKPKTDVSKPKTDVSKPKTDVSKPKDGDQNWSDPCSNCGSLPTVEPTDLCGPCCFGEADTAGGNW